MIFCISCALSLILRCFKVLILGCPLQVPTVQSWLSGSQNSVNVDAIVAEHITDTATAKLKEAVKRNFEEPQAHLEWFCKSTYLLAGYPLRGKISMSDLYEI